MITGEIKNRIDSIWDTFWTGGITNSITILEQMTYLFFMKMLAYVCENGDITKEIVVNESPFDERLSVFTPYMLPLAKYIDTIHGVITPQTA